MDNLVICERQDLSDIADAIREKIESSDGLTLNGMAEAIAGIEAGGSGFESSDYYISSGSFVLTESMAIVPVAIDFPLADTDNCIIVFFGLPLVADRNAGANIAGYYVRNMTDGALTDKSRGYGATVYASSTATSPSTSTSNINVLPDGTNIYNFRGYGSWNFTPHYEYFWIVAKKKVSA